MRILLECHYGEGAVCPNIAAAYGLGCIRVDRREGKKEVVKSPLVDPRGNFSTQRYHERLQLDVSHVTSLWLHCVHAN